MPKCSRFKSPLYLINLGLLLPNVAVIFLQIAYRVNMVASEYPFHCTVGLALPASAVTLCYEGLLLLMYFGIFLKFYCFPNTAQQTAHQSSSLHMMSKRNGIAALTACITSCVNYIIIIALNGHERGLVLSSIVELVYVLFVCYLIIHGLTLFFFT